jgi:hypothetical protein
MSAMPDRIILSIMAAIAVVLIGFAAVWPQGYGARSPGPFGSVPIQQTPQMKAAMAREHAAELRRRQGGAAAVAGLRTGQ